MGKWGFEWEIIYGDCGFDKKYPTLGLHCATYQRSTYQGKALGLGSVQGLFGIRLGFIYKGCFMDCLCKVYLGWFRVYWGFEIVPQTVQPH